METIELPGRLPLLPLHGQVLLPSAFVRVQVSRKAARRYGGTPCTSSSNNSSSSWIELLALQLLLRCCASGSGSQRVVSQSLQQGQSNSHRCICLPCGCCCCCSVALLEHLSAQSARELLVAVVPSLGPGGDERRVSEGLIGWSSSSSCNPQLVFAIAKTVAGPCVCAT